VRTSLIGILSIILSPTTPRNDKHYLLSRYPRLILLEVIDLQ